MTAGRWLVTAAVMAAAAWVLWSAGPEPAEVRAAVADPQGLVDRAGADALLLVVVPVLAWACWTWGAVGLVLTAASTVPGVLGRLAGTLLAGVLPVGARRAAATALGLGLSIAAPTALVVVHPQVAVAAAAVTDDRGVPAATTWADWPTAGDAAPDWPGLPTTDPAAPADGHVVLRGDCLWGIAENWLAQRSPGTPPSSAAVQEAVGAWWQANADVIGPDPDLILPGQVLRLPD